MKRRLIIILTAISVFLCVNTKESYAKSVVDTSEVYTYENFQDDVWILKSKYKKQLQVHETIFLVPIRFGLYQ
ncbi:hypothetical protein HRF69_23930 [Bacillus circulans]|uniref:hypothetical protein n=1 Tax=Niallia circulans TaxID=1397 RepID=UPI0015617CDA|nr:hypothetical protein [Niallia circulans]NRG30132.1 hypothetical protein [Niallia circulans]